MAVHGPVGKENLNISFRLQSKTQIFSSSASALSNAKLSIVASASSHGIVFVGSTNSEIFVVCTKDLELPTAINQNAPVRKVPMPSQVTQLSTNCDGSILAVDVKINGIPHIQLYSVPSFLSPNVQKIREFRVSADNSSPIQLCWNPVINTILAVCTDSGNLNLYSLKDQGIDFHTIDPSLKAKCCCWSPKGKQIVAGFMNGKLMQFNMELKPARSIECPQGTFPGGSFDVIAVQWLSTYQFAIAFLSHQGESRPVLHILNAPKAGPPQYIVYYDACYSTSEVRPSKMYLQYIQQWGMLMAASANCVDVSFLRISKLGDMPEWTLEYPNDQFCAELPLTPEKDESYPAGFELDIACTNKLLQEDGNPYPAMPMMHLVSTYGVLCSFYILNTTNTYVDICSPPRPIDPRILQSLFTVNNITSVTKSPTDENIFKTPIKNDAPAPISHSTPAVPKNNLFGTSTTSTTSPFSIPQTQQSQSNAFSGFSLATALQSKPLNLPQTTSNTFQLPAPKPTVTLPTSTIQQSTVSSQPILQTQPVAQNIQTVPKSQPLISIPPTYNPPASQQKSETKESSGNEKLSEVEDEQIFMRMIQDEIKAFELELKFIMEKSKSLKVNIGTKEESAEMRRKLEELDELKKEATETIESLRSDIQTNRLGLTELFSMVYEAKAKCDQSNNEKSIIMVQNQVQDRSIKRTLDKLKKMISQCEMQIQVVVQLLNSQWANYQDTLSKNKKNKMHIPSLEGVYQTLTKQQEIVYNLNAKLKLLKAKLGICDDVKKQKNANVNATIESLSDSIISMSLIDQVQNEKSKLTEKKLKNLRNYLEAREVVTIKPQRPKLPGLNSEIVIEKKIKAIKSMKKPEPKKTVVQQAAPKQVIPTAIQTVPKSQPSETIFDFTSKQQQSMAQKTTVFAPVTTSSAPQIPTTLAKKDEPQKTFGFGSNNQSVPQANFGLNLGTTPLNLNRTNLQQPSFTNTFSSTSMVLSVEKKKDEQSVTPKVQTVPKTSTEIKPPSTISNTNVSVTANFSVSLPAKSKEAVKENPTKIEEKKTDDSKPQASNDSTTFTFALPAKKDSTPQISKPSASVVSFGNSTSSTASDNVKSAFSFSSNSPFGFGIASKTSESKPAATASSASIFSGSSDTSLGLGDVGKTTNSATSIFSSSSLSNIQIPKTIEESKSNPSSVPAITTTTSIFGTSTAVSSSDGKAPFSFANFGSSVPVTTMQSIVSPTASIFAPKSETSSLIAVSSSPPIAASSTSSTDSVLQGLKICSPTTTSDQVSSTSNSTNIFATPPQSTPKTETSTIFGSSSFATGFGASASTASSSTSSIFASSTSPLTAVSSPTTSTSIFTQSSITTAQATSTFGSLDLSAKSPPTENVFGSTPLVKPDQSVFGQSTSNATTSPSTFGNIFAAAAANSAPKTNVFGSVTPTAGFGNTPQAATPTNIFGTPQNSNLFAQPSQGSIFGATATTTATPSIFSQSTFSTPPANTGSIFGSTTPAQSPFGSSSIFNSGGQQQNQQTSSIFGGSSVFGGAQSATSATGSAFGGSTTTNPQTSPFGGSTNIFAQTQPTFGASATFSSGFGSGQSTFGSGGSIFAQQNQQPVFGGGATFGSPKSSIFGGAATSQPSSGQQSSNIFEQLGQQQQSGNLFGSLAQPNPAPQSGFSGSSFSSWR